MTLRNDTVAELWVEYCLSGKGKDYAHSGSLFYDGLEIFSYGRHFLLGAYHNGLFLLNAYPPSHSSAMHSSTVRGAVHVKGSSHIQVIDPKIFGGNHEQNLNEFDRKIRRQVSKTVRARKYGKWYGIGVRELEDDVRLYCSHFKIPIPHIDYGPHAAKYFVMKLRGDFSK